jgi:hypothetical protein
MSPIPIVKKETHMFDHIWSEETPSFIIAPQGSKPSTDILQKAELYFVWGFLMDPRFIQGLLNHVIPFAPAVIRGYRRESFARDGKRGFRLIPDETGIVMGVVLIAPTVKDIAGLDRFEQVPDVMVKQKVEVMIGDLKREANIYMAAGMD